MKVIEKTSVIDNVVGEVRTLITSGKVAPGEKLPTEKELCESLGVGRSTVREAFRVLQALGYVKIEPGRGAFAAEKRDGLSGVLDWFAERKSALHDYIDVRLAIEPYAARLAAERASEEEKHRLAELVERFISAAEGSDIDRMTLFDQLFHKNIIHATSNGVLVRISEAVFENFVPVLNKMLSLESGTTDPAVTIAHHSAIAEAVAAGDGEMSERLMREHLETARKDIARFSQRQ